MKEFVEKLIERLEELKKRNTGCYGIACIKCKYDNECHEGEKDYKVILDESIKIVNQIAEEYNNGWIPCSERLPEDDERVLCFHSHGFIDCGVLIGKTWCCDMDEYAVKRDNVIAWQPLPEPYIPEAEG